MSTGTSPREVAARALTDALANDMAVIDEMLARVRADVETLQRWGHPLSLAPVWRTRLGLPAEELKDTTSGKPLARKWRPSSEQVAKALTEFVRLAEQAQSDLNLSNSQPLVLSTSNDEEEARAGGLRAAVNARQAANAVRRDAVERQEELSGIEWVVRVLSASPNEVMEVGAIAELMREAGWQTESSNVRNNVAAILGKAADKYPDRIERPGRGQYVWREPLVLDLSAREISEADQPAEKEAEVSRS